MNTVLIVDDVSDNRYLLKSILEAAGYRVLEATQGQEALDMARAEPPALIVADILMPVMDGFTLCREWRTDLTLRAIPFAFYTATYTDPRDETFALSLGADRFLRKPLEPDVLVQEVGSLLRAQSEPTENLEPMTDRELPSVGTPATDDVPHNPLDQAYQAVLFRKLESKIRDLQATRIALEQEIEERKRAEAERLLLERRLLEAQKLQALGTLAHSIAHDFNNCLTGISGHLELAYIIARDQSPACTESIVSAMSGCQMAADLVRRIQQIGAPGGEKLEACDLASIIHHSMSLLDGMKPAQATITLCVAPDLPPVQGNSTQLQEVVVNLGKNALEAIGAESPGRVTIEAFLRSDGCAEQELTANGPTSGPQYERHIGAAVPAGPRVVLQIADTGPGMPADYVERLFEPYFTTKCCRGGTGLGLAVVHRIIVDHGASLQVRSRPGHGSVFSVFLPVAPV